MKGMKLICAFTGTECRLEAQQMVGEAKKYVMLSAMLELTKWKACQLDVKFFGIYSLRTGDAVIWFV